MTTGDDQEFDSYVPQAIDPGSWIYVGLVILCAAILLVAALFLHERRLRKAMSRSQQDSRIQESDTDFIDMFVTMDDDDSNDNLEVLSGRNGTRQGQLRGWNEIAKVIESKTSDGNTDKDAREFQYEHTMAAECKHFQGFLIGMAEMLKQGSFEELWPRARHEVSSAKSTASDDSTSSSYSRTQEAVPSEENIFSYMLNLFHRDEESKQLLKLAIPYSVSSFIENLFHLLLLIVIGHLVGTKELSAYVTVYYAVQLTTMFQDGIVSSLTTVCSQAISAEKYVLAGQYVQLTVISYEMLLLPAAILWWNVMDDFMRWMDFDDDTALTAQSYARVHVISCAIRGIYNALHELLNVCGHEKFSVVTETAQGATLVMATTVVALSATPSLKQIGLLFLFIDVVALLGVINYIFYKGWLKEFFTGIFGSFAFSNSEALEFFLKNALPISLGHILSYGEWKILFILASFMGPAEVTAWSILGEVWSALESITDAWSEAAQVRGSFLLATGEAAAAELSAHKALAMGAAGSFVASTLLGLVSLSFPGLITTDTTLQTILHSLFPIIAFGNMVLALGTISFHLLGAQARYGVATAVQFFGSWIVALPLSLISTFVLHWNLKALAAAVVVGYMISGTLNFCILCCTTWERRSDKIMQRNRTFGDSSLSIQSTPVVVGSYLTEEMIKGKKFILVDGVANDETGRSDNSITAVVQR